MPNVNVLSGDYLASGSYFEVLGTGLIPNLVTLDRLTQPASVTFHGAGSPVTGLRVNLSFLNSEELRKHYNSQYWTLFTGSTNVGPFLEFNGLNKDQYQSTGIIISSGTHLPGKVPGTNFFTKIKLQPLNVQNRIEFLQNSGSVALNSNQKFGVGLTSTSAAEKLHVSGGNFRVDGRIISNNSISSSSLVTSNISATNITGSNLITGFILRGGAGNNIIRGVDTYGATILAGSNNLNTGTFGFLGGGYNNQLLGDSSTIVGGNTNTNCSKFGFIGGGFSNTITSVGSTITESSTIVGGNSNTARGQNTAIVGGYNNKIFSDSSVLVGGINNVLTGNFSTIVGGGYNLITGGSLGITTEEGTCYSTVVGGENNILVGAQSFIGAGLGNFSSGSSLVIGGGSYNQSAGWNSTIAGGYQNRIGITGWGAQGSVRGNYMLHTTPNPEKQWFSRVGYNTIGGGTYNFAVGNSNTIGGGWENEIDGVGNAIPGGWENIISGYPQFYSSVLGGTQNQIMTNYPDPTGMNGVRTYTGIWDHWKGPFAQANTIVGGFKQRILNGKHNTIINGFENIIADSDHVTIEGERNLVMTKATGVFIKGNINSIGSGAFSQVGNPTNGFGLSNVVIFGDGIRNAKSNVVIFNDNRVQNAEDVPVEKSIYFNHLNGIVLQGAGIVAKDNSRSQVFTWYWSGGNPTYDTQKLNERTQPYFNHVLRGDGDNYYPLGYDLLPSLKDKYGYPITGFLFNALANYPITLGVNNRSFKSILTAAWASGQYDLYGSANALTGVGRIQPSENILIGYDNMGSVGDIILGKNNTHAYETGNSNQNYQRGHTYTKFGPSEKDAYNIIVGGDNFISGKYSTTIGYFNRNPFNKGANNIVGQSNKNVPEGYELPVTGLRRMPDGTLKNIIVGYSGNALYSGQVAFESYSNIYGNENEIYSGPLNYNNIVGNFNNANDLEEGILIGNSNYSSGNSSTIIGSRNLNSAESSKIIGNVNWLQNGVSPVVLGDNNVQFNYSSFIAQGELILGKDNSSSSVNQQTIIGNKNYFSRLKSGSSNTYIGHGNAIAATNYKYVDQSNLIGNLNNLDFSDSTVLGNLNSIVGNNINNLGNRNRITNNYGAAFGNDNVNVGDNSLALGTNAYTYNPGQISTSSRNIFEYSSESAAWYAKGGGAQKSVLTWDAISTGINRQEIYLNGDAYDANYNQFANGGPVGRAFIPSGRIWNGDLTITVAETGLRNMRLIRQTFTIANTGNRALPMNMLTRTTLLDNTIGTALAGNNIGLMFSGDNFNDKLAIWVTGLADKKLIWNVTADFLDSWIPTTEQVNMVKPLSLNSPILVPVV